MRQPTFGCSIIACGKRPLTVKINGVARFNAAAAKLRTQLFTLDGEGDSFGRVATIRDPAETDGGGRHGGPKDDEGMRRSGEWSSLVSIA
jgi:hypothetical protein